MISARSIESAEDGDEAAWCQMGRELEDIGITPTMLQENRAFIVAWIKNALSSGQLEEQASQPERGAEYLHERNQAINRIKNSAFSVSNPDKENPAFSVSNPYKGYFIAKHTPPLFVVRTSLGPQTSVRPYWFQGREGSLVTSPEEWTRVSTSPLHL